MANFTTRTTKILASNKFFWGIVALLVVQAIWLALSGRYPMAFDEDFHLGIIKLYADHISPFWSSQPSGADAFGAIARDPSYLYHWLMSFPYRLISAVTDNQISQALFLRQLNIVMFASSLPLFRILMLKTGASRALVHLCLLVFVLLPITPFLAAQINYDNLIMLITPIVLLLTIRIGQSLRTGYPINLRLLVGLSTLCIFASLSKYAFLPVVLGAVFYLLIRLWQTYHSSGALLADFKRGLKLIKPRLDWILVLLLIVGGFLFVERYGINLARYHAPVADCNQVLTVEQCKHYPPWLRDYELVQQKSSSAPSSPVSFAADWLGGMWLRTYFAVDGPASNFATRGPLLLPALSGAVLAIVAAGASILGLRRALKRFNRGVIVFFLFVSIVYIGLLVLQQYQAYVKTGLSVAINGRYLLPILPLLLVVGGLVIDELLERRQKLKVVLAGVVVLCMLWGGGALTYILRSDDDWYWQNSTVQRLNYDVRSTLGPVTPGYSNQKLFMSLN